MPSRRRPPDAQRRNSRPTGHWAQRQGLDRRARQVRKPDCGATSSTPQPASRVPRHGTGKTQFGIRGACLRASPPISSQARARRVFRRLNSKWLKFTPRQSLVRFSDGADLARWAAGECREARRSWVCEQFHVVRTKPSWGAMITTSPMANGREDDHRPLHEVFQQVAQQQASPPRRDHPRHR